MSIEIFDDDIEQLRDDLSAEPWNVISNDDVREFLSVTDSHQL